MAAVYLLPVWVFVSFQLTCIICYIMAVVQGHVVPTVPYISDNATGTPESCVFGLLMNNIALLLGITIYIRYLQVLELSRHHPELGPSLLKHNKMSAWLGFITCLGASIVGNFQINNVQSVHYMGAFCCFGVGNIYFWVETCISYMIQPVAGTETRAHIRLAIAGCCTVIFALQCVTGLIACRLFHGKNPRKWNPEDGGWEHHCVSAVSEWVNATLCSLFILSFSREFRDIDLGPPQVKLVTASYEGRLSSACKKP